MTRPGGDEEPPGAGARAKEGLAQLAETRLWYTDAGGTGPAVVFLHPASGSEAGRAGMAGRLVVPLKPGNAGGGKGPWFKADATSGEGPRDWAT